MRTRILLSVLSLIITLSICAQNPKGVEPRLESSDVEHFIINFVELQKALDIKLENQNDYQSLLQKDAAKLDDIKKTLKKYGYKDHIDFYLKAWSVTACYSYLKIAEENTPELQKALDAIDADESKTDEEKEMRKQQVKMMLDAMGETFRQMVHEDDIETVKPFIDRLHTLFEEEVSY